jgi:hypothetical protein
MKPLGRRRQFGTTARFPPECALCRSRSMQAAERAIVDRPPDEVQGVTRLGSEVAAP